MKVRNGFVTNSSSSCFICQISFEECSGMDVRLLDCGMVQCEHGHTFSESYTLDVEITDRDKLSVLVEREIKDVALWTKSCKERPDDEKCLRWLEQSRNDLTKLQVATSIDDFTDEYDDYIAEVGILAKQCPICQLQHILDEDVLEFILHTYDIDRNEIEENMRMFSSLPEVKRLFQEKQE